MCHARPDELAVQEGEVGVAAHWAVVVAWGSRLAGRRSGLEDWRNSAAAPDWLKGSWSVLISSEEADMEHVRSGFIDYQVWWISLVLS